MRVTRREALMAAAVPTLPPAGVPLVDFGKHKISRLIVGGNPVSGNSHVSPALSREMTDYFSAANVKKLLRDCERAGINTWQSRGDRHIMRLLHEYSNEGGGIQWIAQTASEFADIPRNIREIAGLGAIGIYHHGSSTDSQWHSGKIDAVRDRLKLMRDLGVRVGLGTHIPEVIDYAESKDWDVDYYMTCVYNLSQSHDFRDEDRVRMLERVRRTRRQCLVFKVYGATRKCGSAQEMRAAMKFVFQYMKSTDCVVVGMFPKHREQIEENCSYLREAIS